MTDHPDAERRHFHRIPFPTDGTLQLPEHTVDVELIDLSLNGALVHPSEPLDLPEGTACVLKLPLSAEVTIVMAASVAHHATGRLGLTCTHIDIDSVQHLRRLVELNLGDDALLHRELAALIDSHRTD